MASPAWTIYRDLKKDAEKPGKAVLARKLRLELRDVGHLAEDRRDLIVEAVIEEVMAAGA